jgi:hypothetical protein
MPKSQQTLLLELVDDNGKATDNTYRLQGRGTGSPTIGNMWFHHPPGVGASKGIRIKLGAADRLRRTPDKLRTTHQTPEYANLLVRSIDEHNQSQK